MVDSMHGASDRGNFHNTSFRAALAVITNGPLTTSYRDRESLSVIPISLVLEAAKLVCSMLSSGRGEESRKRIEALPGAILYEQTPWQEMPFRDAYQTTE